MEKVTKYIYIYMYVFGAKIESDRHIVNRYSLNINRR